jgi:hypothetical protein
MPNGIRWVVERLFAWLSRYRRLNIVYDRAPDLFAAHIWIAMISIISRRLVAQTQVSQGIYSCTDSKPSVLKINTTLLNFQNVNGIIAANGARGNAANTASGSAGSRKRHRR